jgi:hypothetical protein
MQPAIAAFWNAYVTARAAEMEPAALLERCVTYGAARMIQTVFEAMYASPALTPHAVMLLQVSLNVLESPQDAIRELYGLDQEAAR